MLPAIANVLYAVGLMALSPLVLYRMLRHGRYRRGVASRLWGLGHREAERLRGDAPQCVWLHAVSVGEINLLATLLGRLEFALSEYTSAPRVVISTSTDSGYDLAVQRFGAHRVFFCPLDFSWAVNRTVRNLRPRLLVLAELELWPNLVAAAKRRGCDVAIVNGRLSQRSGDGYARFDPVVRPTFQRIDWVGAQDGGSAQRFMQRGVPEDRVEMTGSLKFDGAPTSRDCVAVQERVHWSAADPWHRVWCFGSTQAGEESLALQVYQSLRTCHADLRLILVPRHRERFDEVARLVTAAGLRVLRRSQHAKQPQTTWDNDTVILVDTIGELRHWWGVCQIATVGGSFGDRGGQNMLEPAGYGCAVSFGPNTKNFSDIATRLIDGAAAVRVHDRTQLTAFISRCLDEPTAADTLGRNAQDIVRSQQGATDVTVDRLVRLCRLSGHRQPSRRAA